MITLKQAVVAALVQEAGHHDINLPIKVWEYVKHVPGANEELVKSVVAGLMVASVNRDMDDYQTELDRLK